MGKMKDLMIDQMNNELPPLPEEIDLNSGRGKWVFDDVEVWAYTYEQALELVPYIKS
jgi:hypothetical protein